MDIRIGVLSDAKDGTITAECYHKGTCVKRFTGKKLSEVLTDLLDQADMIEGYKVERHWALIRRKGFATVGIYDVPNDHHTQGYIESIVGLDYRVEAFGPAEEWQPEAQA